MPTRFLRRTATATVVSVLVSQVVLGSIFYLYGQARHALDLTRQTQLAIGDLAEMILLTENNNRAYLLTRDPIWLPEIDRALLGVSRAFEELRSLGKEDEFARAQAEHLEPLVSARVARMVEARQLVQSDPELVRRRLAPGGISHKIQTELRAALKAGEVRAAEISHASNEHGGWLSIMFLLANMGLGVGFYFIIGNLKARFLKDLTTEKMLRKSLEDLMRELHHRVRNSLQSVNSLLTLQSRTIQDPRVRASFTDALGRVDAISRVHEHFYNEIASELPACKYIHGLVQNLQNLLPLDLEFHCDENLKLPLDAAVPLGLMVNELLTNAGKHAVTGDGRAKAVLTLMPDGGEGGWRLSYSDNGPGLPPDIDLEKARSLGFRLLRSFAQQLGAVLIFPQAEAGLRIQVFCPLSTCSALAAK
jgi:two-component sensor histidine kinase